MFNPTRRNKNIGTEKQGYGQNNKNEIASFDLTLLGLSKHFLLVFQLFLQQRLVDLFVSFSIAFYFFLFFIQSNNAFYIK